MDKQALSMKRLSSITIKQLLSAQLESDTQEVIIDGQAVLEAVIVGKVQSIDVQSSFTTIIVNDYSGVVPVKYYHEDNGEPNPAAALR